MTDSDGPAAPDEQRWPGPPPDIGREDFLLTLLGGLAETLDSVVGEHAARGFVALVGARLGDRFAGLYRRAFATESLDGRQVGQACVDLKNRIGGGFYLISETPERIELGNRRCPFAEHVVGRPVLCMMTSSTFGRVAAENLGYAKVEIAQAIARGDSCCRVILHLESEAAGKVDGVEYFRVGAPQ